MHWHIGHECVWILTDGKNHWKKKKTSCWAVVFLLSDSLVFYFILEFCWFVFDFGRLREWNAQSCKKRPEYTTEDFIMAWPRWRRDWSATMYVRHAIVNPPCLRLGQSVARKKLKEERNVEKTPKDSTYIVLYVWKKTGWYRTQHLISYTKITI